MSKSYDKIDGKKVREQYFRSERRVSKMKNSIKEPLLKYMDKWHKKWNQLYE